MKHGLAARNLVEDHPKTGREPRGAGSQFDQSGSGAALRVAKSLSHNLALSTEDKKAFHIS